MNDSERDHPLSWLEPALADWERAGLRRTLRTRDGAAGESMQTDGRSLVNFGSNDYLGLAGDPRLAAAAAAAAELAGWGSGASPLITGRTREHALLEEELARFEQTEAALLFPSGFAANAGTIPALVEAEDVILADAHNHASLIDGCRLARAATRVYRHNDLAHLRELLAANRDARRKLIVTDSLFSMEGDIAPLAEIAALADEFSAMLLVDEAHAGGVFGEQGRGLCEAAGIEHRVDVKVGTLSKAFGCSGGFVAGRRMLIDWLANKARSYVFSTAQPVPAAAAARAALAVIREEPQRRRKLLERAAALRARLQAQGWNTGRSATQVIPLHVGEAARAMALSAALAERGFFVPGIRPPSVPAGGALLRISLCRFHQPRTLEALCAALDEQVH